MILKVKADNMILEKQMLLTLSDNDEYIVLDTITYNTITYVYLVGYTNKTKMKFCIEEIENDQVKLTEVNNIELRQQLLKIFTEKLQIENT